MADQKSGTRNSVGLLDIARQVPGLLMDTPTILRGVVTGFGARPSAKTSIGKVFQDRAAQYGDKLFLKFEDQAITYRQANETVNRYAAVLAARGVGHGDVVGIMLRNSPDPVLLMLAAVKCGAISGMLNYNQRGDVLKHSLGLLSATVIVADPDFVDPIKDSGADTDGSGDTRRVQEARRDRADRESAHRVSSSGQGQGVLHLHVGHDRHAEGQHHDALPVAAGTCRLRRSRNATEQQRHPVLLPAAVPQQRFDGRAVVGSQRGFDTGAWQVVLGVEVLGRRDPLRRHRVRLHRRGLRIPAQPAGEGHRSQAQGAGDRGKRSAPGDLGRIHRAVRHRPGLRVLRGQ